MSYTYLILWALAALAAIIARMMWRKREFGLFVCAVFMAMVLAVAGFCVF